jgi:uncharacterized protein
MEYVDMTDNPWDDVTVWHEFMSLDPERARKFYEEVLGLTTTSLEGAPFSYTLWMQDGNPIGGLIPPQNENKTWPSGSTPHWVSSFATDNVDQAVQKTQELGGQVLLPPTDIPKFGRAAVLKDPEGAVFGVFQKRR